MRVEQVDGEATYFVGQVTACFMIDAARFGTQLDRLRHLVPIACHSIEFVHIRLDGSFTRVRRVTGGFDQLVDVLSFLLQEALGFHFVAVDEVIDQFGRVILAAQRNPLHRVRHDLHKRRRWQPVEGVLDGAAEVPFTFRQFGFDLVECSDLREAGDSTVFIDVAQDIFGIDLIHEVSNLLNETGQIFRIVFAIHRLEGGGEQIQVSKRGQARFLPDRHSIMEQTFNELGCLSWRNAGEPCDLRAQPGAWIR